MTVLVVEDDSGIASFIVKGLRAEGYAVTSAGTGTEAQHWLATIGEDIEVVLLDLGLPDIDGTSLLRRWRSDGVQVPMIVLTARDALHDKVSGLDSGANDYITKPFAFEELIARVRAALRKNDQASASQLVVDDLRLDLLTKVAWREGRRIDLAPREWALLELFMRHPNQILSRTQILNRVWDYGFEPGSNIVDVYVGYVRKKINSPGETPLLETIRRAGYRLRRPT